MSHIAIDKEINRKGSDYKAFLRQVKELNGGKCELIGDTNNIDVDHLYSMRKYPEFSYNQKNAVILNKNLHKEYHRRFSPYNTYSFTFLAWLHWLRDEKKLEG
ncbi:hypothetical protein ACTQ5K_02055 [Niallia sp. Sow4_A1]|uniref:hypothetical protein n=1 Tax=Niallia sp. Sow4_A1 TaxID=3438793 RepID=UPI003F9EAAED